MIWFDIIFCSRHQPTLQKEKKIKLPSSHKFLVLEVLILVNLHNRTAANLLVDRCDTNFVWNNCSPNFSFLLTYLFWKLKGQKTLMLIRRSWKSMGLIALSRLSDTSFFFFFAVLLPNFTISEDGRKKKTVKRLCVTKVTDQVNLTLMFFGLLQKRLFKGEWNLAKSYFIRQNYCLAWHTMFASSLLSRPVA